MILRETVSVSLVPRRWRSLAFAALVLTSFSASPVAFAQGGADTQCQPARAESLRPLVEALDRARRDGEAAELRRLCVSLAEQLLDGTPDGAFPISSERWLGPSQYLQEFLSLVDPDLRSRVLETIEAALTARIKARTAATDGVSIAAALDLPQLLRLERDFPELSWASDIEEALATRLLEAGWIEAFFATATSPELRAQFAELRQPAPAAPTWSAALAAPLRAVRRFDWTPSKETGSPFSLPAQHIPARDGALLFLQDLHRVTCVDTRTGAEVWRTPFLVDARETGSFEPVAPLPGSLMQPTLHRGLVITSSRRAVTAFDAHHGAIRWDLHLSRLFDGSESQPDALPPALCASPPVSTEMGTLVAIGQLRQGTFELRLVLIDDDGQVRWNRAVGTASGATYLALGSSRPTVAVRGTAAYVLTGRGLLCAHHVADGALLWAVRYPSFLDSGSRDALQNQGALLNPSAHAWGEWIVCAAADTATINAFDAASGTLRVQLPRGSSRWWTLAPRVGAAALASARTVTLWDLAGRPSSVLTWQVPEGLPAISGPPVESGNRWLLPHASGFYDLGPSGDWRIRLLRADFEVEHVLVTSGETLLVSGNGRAQLFAPHPPEDYQQPGLAGELLRARALLLQGEGLELVRAIEGLTSLPRGNQGNVATEQLVSFAEECLEYGEYGALPLADDEQLGFIESLLSRLPRDGFFAQAAYDQAVAAARRGRPAVAARMAYTALRSPAGTILRVTPHLVAPVELAVARLLLQLGILDGLPSHEQHELAAQDSLDRARAADELQAYANVARLYPLTVAGRRAQLETARKYYRQGHRQLSIECLQGLILIEPETPESVDARLYLCQIYIESRRTAEAHELLNEIESNFGDERLVTSQGSESIAERVTKYREQLAAIDAPTTAPPRRPDPTLPLVPAWRTRTDFAHQRSVHVLPVPKTESLGEDLLLIAAQRQVELRSAKHGDSLWVAKLPSRPLRDGESLFSQRGLLDPPVGVAHGLVVVTDGDAIWAFDLLQGHQRWMVEPETANQDRLRNPIERIGMNEELVLAWRSEGLRAHDTRTGRLLWEQEVRAPLPGALHFAPGQVVIGFEGSLVAEVRSTADGRVLQQLGAPSADDPASELDALTQQPWFTRDGDVIVAQGSGLLRGLDAVTGAELWRTQLPGKLVEVHFVDAVPFVVAELRRRPGSPNLVGVDPSTGRILWDREPPIEREPRSAHSEIHQITFHEGDLYVLESRATGQRVVRIQIPPVFLHPETWTSPPQSESLATLQTLSLGNSHEAPQLRFDGDYILAVYRSEPNVVVLSRASRLVQSDRYAAMEQFLAQPGYSRFTRNSLHFADFVGDTLVLVTARGSMGLRAKSRSEFVANLWRSLQDVDSLNAPERTPVTGAECAYRYGDVEAACQIVEAELARPGLLPAVRRSLTWLLEGLAQERGEAAPPSWIVPRLAAPPRIDGSLDEDWHAQTAIPVRAARYFHPVQGTREDGAAWHGWRDLSAMVYFGWTQEGFHLAVDVTDDNIHAYDREAPRWVGDCLLIGIDFEGDRGSHAGPNDQLLTLALTVPKQAPPPGPDGAPANGDPPPDDDKDEPEGQYQVQRKKDGSGVIYEMTMPWPVFRDARPGRGPEAPYPGLDFSLNLLLTDDDTGRGATSYFTLSPGQLLREDTRGIWEVFIPDFFPRLSLGQ
ncbi:MAG: PQQ-binding-like beta-propeller repeat protein [Planctomycetota bacterium]